MKLLANTVLQHNENAVNYEILLVKDMLVFKPYFYHLEHDFPCIILSRFSSGWQFQELVAPQIRCQIEEDLKQLHLPKAA